MKKLLVAIAFIIILSPSLTFANTKTELEAKHIQLLEQLIVLLKAQLEQLIQAKGLQQPQAVPQVLGAATSTVSTASTTKAVTKKRSGGGGGGGGGSRSTSDSLVFTMVGEGNTFNLTSNQALSLETVTINPLVFPEDKTKPVALTLEAKINDGSTETIILVKDSVSFSYSADLRARLLPGQLYTGEFEVVIPDAISSEYIQYSVLVASNGVTRTINLENAGDTLLSLLNSAEDPEATYIFVDSEDVSSAYEVFAFDLKNTGGAASKINQITIDTVLQPDISLAEVMNEAVLVIGDEEYLGSIGDEMITFDDIGYIANGNTTTKFRLISTFKPQLDEYVSGQTIKFEVSSSSISSVRGDNDQYVPTSGIVIGDVHTLIPSTIYLPPEGVTVTVDTLGDNDQIGEFAIEFEVTALGEDFYITDNTGLSVIDGVAYSVQVGSGSTTVSGVLTSTADEESEGVFTIRDGETETFTLTVTVDTTATTQARVTLTEVNFTSNPDGVTQLYYYTPEPASDFRTPYKNINAN